MAATISCSRALLVFSNTLVNPKSQCRLFWNGIAEGRPNSVECEMTAIVEESKGLLPRIALIACGCFSPPTPMHMRLFGECE